jgi:D-alanyl-D-alanine carboxypeptidase (penicillin-binding protein 5/6)
LNSGAHERSIVNRNTLVRTVAAVDGVKTGHTQSAGYVLVGSATRDGVTVVSAVLGDPNEAARDADSLALLGYGLNRYRRATPVRRGQSFARVKLRFGDDRLGLVASRTIRRTVRRDEPMGARVVGAPAEVEGPLPAGARVGTIEVRWRGRTVERVALITARAVPAPSIFQRLGGFLGRTLIVLVVAAVALGSLQVMLLRRSHRRRRGQARGTEIA